MNWEVVISKVEYWQHATQSLFCLTPVMKKTQLLIALGSRQTGDLNIYAHSTPQHQKWREDTGGKHDVECTGKVAISMVGFLAVGETCKAIF